MSDRPADQSLRRRSEGIRRRDFLLNGSSALVVASAASMLPATTNLAMAQLPSRPHIVYIVADDLGWKDVGFHGSDIKTPNIDKLAQKGARLEQFYVQPMCTPTRAALMTGRYPVPLRPADPGHSDSGQIWLADRRASVAAGP